MSNAVARPRPDAPTHCTPEQYEAMYRRSVEAPDTFWLEQAQRLDWFAAPTIGGVWAYDPVAMSRGRECTRDGGTTNASASGKTRTPTMRDRRRRCVFREDFRT